MIALGLIAYTVTLIITSYYINRVELLPAKVKPKNSYWT